MGVYVSGKAMKKIIETEKLVIRHFAHSDLTALMDLLSDAEAMRFIGPRRAMTQEEGAEWLSRQLELQKSSFTRFVVAIKATNEFIGVCGVQLVDGVLDFGYFFRRRFWGQGLALEACENVLAYLSANSLMKDFVVFVAEDNINSKRLLLKLGFKLGMPASRNNEQGYFCYKPDGYYH
jgi:[ribosomal protein S5]-alanine N-acetyltransferase